MIQPGRASRRRRTSRTLPRIQADVVVIAARGQKRRLSSKPLCDFETEHIRIESEGTVEVSHFEMHMTDLDSRINCLHSHKIPRKALAAQCHVCWLTMPSRHGRF